MRVLTLLASALLLGCNQRPEQYSFNTGECLDLPVWPPAGVVDLKQTVSACVERNAALYAKGPDTPEALSRAVIAKCQGFIIQYVADEAKKAGEQPDFEAAIEGWRQRTLPVIAEARARKCYS